MSMPEFHGLHSHDRAVRARLAPRGSGVKKRKATDLNSNVRMSNWGEEA